MDRLKCLSKYGVPLAVLVFLSAFSYKDSPKDDFLRSSTDSGGFVVDKIVAKVDNYIILKSEIDRQYLDYVSNGGTPVANIRCQILAIMTRNKLMAAKAEIDSVVVPDDEVDRNTQQRIDAILSQYGGSRDDVEKLYGKSIDQIKLELRDQIKEQLIAGKMQRTITDDISVTPAEVRRFYNQIPKDSIPYFSAQVEAAQIVRVAKPGEAQKERVKNKLIEIRERILKGEDFATLARQFSEDPSVGSNDGDMGFQGRGALVPAYEKAAFELKNPGEISMPVETKYGFHIIQLLERRGNEYHSRHILISPKPSKEDSVEAARYLDSLRVVIKEDKISFEKAAKEYSDDEATKLNGGFFVDPDTRSTSLFTEDLESYVFFTIDSMKVGDISKPITYRTDDGKDAVRIIYYKSRKPPHLASLEDDWQRIQVATLNQKKELAMQKWFMQARQDVYIHIEPEYDYCGLLK